MDQKPKTSHRSLLARLRQTLITQACYSLGKILNFTGSRDVMPQTQLLHRLENAKIVIIKPCCLGDVELSTPVVATLRKHLPNAHLTYIVSEWARPILAHNSRLNEIIDSGFVGSRFGWRSYFALANNLRQRHYDLAIVLDRSPILAMLPLVSGIKLRAGLDSLGRGFALNYKATVWPGQPKHEAEMYLDVIRTLGITPEEPKLEFFPGELARQNLLQKVTALHFDLDSPFAVLHPGGGQNPDTVVNAKQWPASNFGEIAFLLVQKGLKVVIIGAESDRKVVDATLNSVKNLVASGTFSSISAFNNLYNFCGLLDISETGELLNHTKLFVGNDTGLMHIASSTNAAVVAIFGPSSPAMYGPYTPKGRSVSPVASNVPGGLPLAEYQALSVEQGGIGRVSVGEVWQKIEEALSNNW